jgi:hypothetical protein
MAKKSVAKLPAKKQAPQTVSLSQVEITWTPRKIFSSEEQKPRTISGQQLAWVLDAIPPSTLSPTWGAQNVIGSVELELRGLTELFYALSITQETDVDLNALFHLLHAHTVRLTMEVEAAGGLDPATPEHTGRLTITPAAPKADDGKAVA